MESDEQPLTHNGADDELTNVIENMDISGGSKWTADDESIFKQWTDYLENMKQRKDELWVSGPNRPTGKPWPKQPAFHLKRFEYEQATPKDPISAEEQLHEKLKAMLISADDIRAAKPITTKPNNLVSYGILLKARYHDLRRHERAIFAASLELGETLEEAFKQHKKEYKKKTQPNWCEWLKRHVGLSVSQADKYRSVYRTLKDFPRFKCLTISFRELSENLPGIREMLQIDKYQKFWKQSGQSVLKRTV